MTTGNDSVPIAPSRELKHELQRMSTVEEKYCLFFEEYVSQNQNNKDSKKTWSLVVSYEEWCRWNTSEKVKILVNSLGVREIKKHE